MELKRDSFNTRLYKWFYCKRNGNLPDNLCPFFWQTVLMYLTIVPYSLYSVVIIVLEQFNQSDSNSVWERLGYATLMNIFIFAGWAVLFVPYFGFTWGWDTDSSGFWTALYITGGVCWFIGIVVGGWELLKFIVRSTVHGVDHAIESTGGYEKTTMVKEFIKAKYNRYCPKINWK